MSLHILITELLVIVDTLGCKLFYIFLFKFSKIKGHLKSSSSTIPLSVFLMHCPSLRFYIFLCSRKLEVSPLKICLHQKKGKIVCMQKQRFTYKTALQTYVLQCEYFRILRACRLERGSDHIWNVGIKSYICIISKYIWVKRIDRLCKVFKLSMQYYGQIH